MVMGGIDVVRERVVEFERSNWMQQVGSLTQMVAQLQAANEALQAQTAQDTARINQLLTDLNGTQAERDEALDQIDSANRQVGELQAQLSKAQSDIDDLKAEYTVDHNPADEVDKTGEMSDPDDEVAADIEREHRAGD